VLSGLCQQRVSPVHPDGSLGEWNIFSLCSARSVVAVVWSGGPSGQITHAGSHSLGHDAHDFPE